MKVAFALEVRIRDLDSLDVNDLNYTIEPEDSLSRLAEPKNSNDSIEVTFSTPEEFEFAKRVLERI